MKTRKSLLNHLALVSLIALASGANLTQTASASVVITDWTTAGFADASSDSFNYTVQNANSALVMGIYVDTSSAPSSVTFGDVAPDHFFTNDRVTLAYWLNPATGNGTLKVEGITGPHLLVGAYELGNVNLNATITTSTGSSITTPTDNEFVLSFTGNNGTNTHATGASIIDTAVFSINDNDFGGVTGGGSIGGGAGLAGLAGSQDVNWSPNTAAISSVSFQAVPEPSSFALLAGCFGMTWLMLRRRQG